MEKFTGSEDPRLPVRINGRETNVSRWIRTLEPGDTLKISRADWRSKIPPFYIANYIKRTKGWKFLNRTLADGSGWLIKRTS